MAQEEEPTGLWGRFLKFVQPSPEAQAHAEALQRLSVANTFYDNIIQALNRQGRYASYDKDLADRMAMSFATDWFTNFSSEIFPQMDEFELRPGIVLRAADYDQRQLHQKFSLNHLGAWIDTQKAQLQVR